MLFEYTFAMIKSKATRSNLVGMVMDRILYEGFVIVRAQHKYLTPEQINTLYAPHIGKDYWNDLADSVGHGVVVMVLGHEHAIQHWRDVMGATDPKNAEPNTIRHWARTEKRMADNIVHGSEDAKYAKWEIRMFFPGLDTK